MIRENQNVWANNFQAWKLGDHGENWTMFIRNYQIKTFQTILDQKNRQIKLHPEKNVRSRHFSMHYYKKYRQSWTTFRRVVRSSHFIKIITKYRRKLLTERLSNQIWPCFNFKSYERTYDYSFFFCIHLLRSFSGALLIGDSDLSFTFRWYILSRDPLGIYILLVNINASRFLFAGLSTAISQKLWKIPRLTNQS